MLAEFSLPIGVRKLVTRTAREALDDDILNLAAQLSYYFFLALFPALLVVLALASFFPLENLADNVTQSLEPVASPAIVELLREQMRRLGQADSGGILTIGMLGALWSSSAAVVAITTCLNRAYDIDESRPWWKVRLIAIGLTVALAIFVLLSLTLVMVGPTLAEQLASRFGLGLAFAWTWKIVQWPVAFLLVSTAVGMTYYFAVDADQDWVWLTPGAVLATGAWILVSLGFKLYVARFTDYNAAYGTIGAVVVLLLWFYVSSLAILIGAEFNAEIDQASPYGQDPGEKRPGARKIIGRRAARIYRERQQHHVPHAGHGSPAAPI